MRNRREEIDYHNRKFKLHLTGTRDLGDFTFRIQPPNETANSNNYNQCLVKISKAVLTNRGDTITGGLDAVPVSGTIAASVAEVCPTGILLTTGVRCSNEIHYTSFTSVPIEQGLQIILHNKNGASHNGAAVLGGGVVAGAALCQRGVAAAPTQTVQRLQQAQQEMVEQYQLVWMRESIEELRSLVLEQQEEEQEEEEQEPAPVEEVPLPAPVLQQEAPQQPGGDLVSRFFKAIL